MGFRRFLFACLVKESASNLKQVVVTFDGPVDKALSQSLTIILSMVKS